MKRGGGGERRVEKGRGGGGVGKRTDVGGWR